MEIEINELWKLMMMKYKWEYHVMENIAIYKLQLDEYEYISKINGEQAHREWDPRRGVKTTRKCCSQAYGQQQQHHV